MNEKLIRTFLSIPVPPDVRAKKNMLYSTLEDSPAQINWVANKNLHLTIKFIGFTPESTFKGIIHTLKSITENLNPFTLEIKNTGCFPAKERPRILWMGVQGNTSPLFLLISNIEKEMEKLGFSKDKNVFFPHITVARINYPQKYTPKIERFLNSFYDPIDFSIDRMQFFSSELLPSGSIHTLLQSFPFGEKI